MAPTQPAQGGPARPMSRQGTGTVYPKSMFGSGQFVSQSSNLGRDKSLHHRPSTADPSRPRAESRMGLGPRKKSSEQADLEAMYLQTYQSTFRKSRPSAPGVDGNDYMSRLRAYTQDPEAQTYNLDKGVGVQSAAEYFARLAKEDEARERNERLKQRAEIRKKMQLRGYIPDEETLQVERRWAMMTRAERAWFYMLVFVTLLDLAFAAAFIYQGFVLYAGDTQIDPIAWKLAFGLPAFLLIVKLIMTVLDVQTGVAGWLALLCGQCAGLLYGTVNRFLALYNGQFPCFIGYHKWNPVPMCYNGKTLVGLGTAALYLLLQGGLFYKYCQHRTYIKQRRNAKAGRLDTLEDMMAHIDMRMLEEIQAEEARNPQAMNAPVGTRMSLAKKSTVRSQELETAAAEHGILGGEVSAAIARTARSTHEDPGGDLELDHRKKSMAPMPARVEKPGEQSHHSDLPAVPQIRMLGDPMQSAGRTYSLRKQNSMKGPAPFLSSAREDKSLSRMGSAATRSPDRSRLKNSTQFGQSLSMARAAAAASPAMQTPVAPKGMVRVEDAHESADGAPGPSRVQFQWDSPMSPAPSDPHQMPGTGEIRVMDLDIARNIPPPPPPPGA